MSSRSLRATAARRLSASVLLCSLMATIVPLASSAATDKTLERVKGAVSYDMGDNKPHAISGQLVLPDNAFAVTDNGALARLQLPDSSTIEIGQHTRVQVGAFSPAESGKLNYITLNNGAIKFNIHRPAGGKSNYQFVTPTSQIAVRGTAAFLAAGPQGTMVSCIACAAGDVTVTTGSTTTALVTGQTLTVSASGGVVTGSSVASNAGVNNPEFNQINGETNPFGAANSPPSDPTGSA
ncbi:MAG: FecR domain-containing protein, partial [Candidatus Eremiobacteraeota bacterium]|nr:FecR domain-containing protein [Candidatus Eremiobacteraeota bacterium]